MRYMVMTARAKLDQRNRELKVRVCVSLSSCACYSEQFSSNWFVDARTPAKVAKLGSFLLIARTFTEVRRQESEQRKVKRLT